MTNYFSKNLKYLRKKKNIDQQVMAEDLGVAQSTLSCWENGLRTPDLDTIANIAKYLNIYDDFITNDLTIADNSKESTFDELDLLWSKYKDELSDDGKEMIKFMLLKRKKEIDEQKNNN